MKNLYLFSLMLLCSLGSYAQCITNGNFEGTLVQLNDAYDFRTRNGGFDVLDCNIITPLGGATGFGSPNATQNTLTSVATLVTGTGNDPILANSNIFIPMVHPGGNASIKLGDYPPATTAPGGTVTTMQQTFTPTSTVISFFFSLILEDSHQGTVDQPFFTARIYDGAGNIINSNPFCITADPGNTDLFSLVPGTSILYTNWRCGRLNIPEIYLDEELTIEFVVTDCGQTAHFGTVYIDDITCDAACANPPLGFIELDPAQYNCPTGTIDICGVFSSPTGTVSQTFTLDVMQGNTIVATLSNPQINGDTFCFSLNPAVLDPGEGFELSVTGDFLMSSSFVYTLLDQSSVPGTDLIINLVNPSDATFSGNILSWPDVADTYQLEFVSDGACCPGWPYGEESTYSVTLNVNQIDLFNEVTAQMGAKCFRWRIRTGDCPNWSDWCCISPHGPFEGSQWGNPLDECYPEGCIPTMHATLTEVAAIIEEREDWITAENTIAATANVTYQAGNYVELQEGFNTVTGAVFLGIIDDCSDTAPKSFKYTFIENIKSCIHDGEKLTFGSIQNFTAYPNPTKGQVTLTFDTKISVFTVMDINGKVLMKVENDNPNQITLDLSKLAPGTYLISGDGIPAQKIIKN